MNKVKFGLRNVHYAKMTVANDGTISYGTPVPIPGGVNLSLSGVGDTNDFFADDSIYYSNTANQGYEGDLEIALIPKSFLKDIMGMEEDSNGALLEKSDAVISPFALGFEVQGDEKGRRSWFYNCIAARPNQNASTIENSKTPSTETLSLKAMPRLTDKAVKTTMELSSDNQTAFNSFFNSVYEKTGSV